MSLILPAYNDYHPDHETSLYIDEQTKRFVILDEVTQEILVLSGVNSAGEIYKPPLNDEINNPNYLHLDPPNADPVFTEIVFVEVLDEGSPIIRFVKSKPIGNNIFQFKPEDDYDPESEEWQFVPGSYVRAHQIYSNFFKQNIMFAYELVEPADLPRALGIVYSEAEILAKIKLHPEHGGW